MVKLVLFALFAASSLLSGQSIVEKEMDNMSKKQRRVLVNAYIFGKNLGIGYSLAAIAWKESHAGKYTINLASKDCGIYQSNVYTVSNRHSKKGSFNQNILCQKLIEDEKFAAAEAIAELTFWKQVHKGKWRNVWASYNAGYNYDSSRGRKYSESIAVRVKILKRRMGELLRTFGETERVLE